ncbi:MAG: DUF2076 domain-containing protein, partial [Bradyrhizobiaceae bacterium]|nr:DUF2076 domain-containing protein [Bradyrhizobiaceae bacterium]
MTPQERDLITELFDRIASLEGSPRDSEAEREIAAGLARAPHAIYPLVQTVLVQDEALKRANARIQELEGSDDGAGAREGGSFLDSMRGALFGRDSSARGSVPPVPPGSTSGPYAPPPPPGPDYAPPGYAPSPGYAPPPGYAPSPGGSFLGTAAASAAGVIGGSLLLGSIRSMFGHGHAFAGAPESSAPGHSPWDDRGAAHSDLAREAGADDVGSRDHQHSAGLFDTADNE